MCDFSTNVKLVILWTNYFPFSLDSKTSLKNLKFVGYLIFISFMPNPYEIYYTSDMWSIVLADMHFWAKAVVLIW